MEPTKREFRRLKRELKRAGSQHRRRQWKRDLRDRPEDAPYSEERFGRFSTAELNGNDKPRVRETPRREESPSSGLVEGVEPDDAVDPA